MRNKWTRVAGWTAAGGMVLLLLIAVAGWGVSRFSGQFGDALAMTVWADFEVIEVGDPIRIELCFDLPVHYTVGDIKTSFAPGLIQVDAPRVRRGRWKWSRQAWRVEFLLYPMRAGKAAAGTVRLSTGYGGEFQVHTVELPVIEVLLPDDRATYLIELAPAYPVIRGRSRRAWLLLLLLPGLAAAWWWSKHRGTRQPMRCWKQTLRELSELQNSLRDDPGVLSAAVVRLTDIMRRYLEDRFGIPVSAATTPEFLALLQPADTPVPPPFRPFLAEWLESADRVKFARAQLGRAELEVSIARAVELVRATRPVRDEEVATQIAWRGTQ